MKKLTVEIEAPEHVPPDEILRGISNLGVEGRIIEPGEKSTADPSQSSFEWEGGILDETRGRKAL
jgi:hypothetical protein